MDDETARVLARIEGKINLVVKCVGAIAAVGGGVGCYMFIRAGNYWYIDTGWAPYIGVAAAIAIGSWVDWRMRRLESFLPYDF